MYWKRNILGQQNLSPITGKSPVFNGFVLDKALFLSLMFSTALLLFRIKTAIAHNSLFSEYLSRNMNERNILHLGISLLCLIYLLCYSIFISLFSQTYCYHCYDSVTIATIVMTTVTVTITTSTIAYFGKHII